MAERQFLRSGQQFDSQMDESIQRRVADAKKAGIHPLYALGASSGASPTITTSGGAAPTGGSVSDSMRGIGEAIARATIKRDTADAKKSEAEAALADSKTATISQRLATQGRDGANITNYPSGGKVVTYPVPGNDFTDGPVYGPAEFYNPEVPTSQRTGVRSGSQPGMVEIKMPDGRTVLNYDPDLGLDEIGQLNFALQRARHHTTDVMEKSFNWASKNLSDQALVAWLKKRLATKGNPNPPNSRHRTRRRK